MTVARCSVMSVAFLVVLSFSASALEVPPFQKLPITLSATKTLPEDLQKGSNYQVDDAIINDGLINTYYLKGEGTIDKVTIGLYLH